MFEAKGEFASQQKLEMMAKDESTNAAAFVDTLSSPKQTRFDGMSKAEIRMDRLKSRGLL